MILFIIIVLLNYVLQIIVIIINLIIIETTRAAVKTSRERWGVAKQLREIKKWGKLVIKFYAQTSKSRKIY